MSRTREQETGGRAQSLLSPLAERQAEKSAESRLALALARARAERTALELRRKRLQQSAYEPASRTGLTPVLDRALSRAELDDIAALARQEAAIVARRIAEDAAHSQQAAINEIRIGLREIRAAIHDLANARARRRYF
jgi:hypothetical protein